MDNNSPFQDTSTNTNPFDLPADNAFTDNATTDDIQQAPSFMDSPVKMETTPDVLPAQTPPSPVSMPTPAPAPVTPKPVPQPTMPQPVPATLPNHKKSGSPAPLIFTALGGGLLLTTASTAFLYVQNQTLKHQLNTLQAIEAQRELPSPTPTPSGSITPTQSSDNTGSPTQNVAFTRINDAVNAAQQFSPTAQLLMITTTGTITPNTSESTSLDTSNASYNFWFRKAPGTKNYFFVTVSADNSDPKVVTPASVTPDNNIPDLLDSLKNNQMGLDVDQAHSLVWTQLLKDYTKGNRPTSISAKYLRSLPSNPSINQPVNLWQITYKFDPSANIKDVVVQVDANSKQVIYNNLPKNTTATPSVTTTPTPTTTTTGS